MKKIFNILIGFFLTFMPALANEDPIILPSQTGIVQSVEYIDLEDNQVKQTAEIKLKDGNLILVDNMITGNPYYDIKLKKGIKVILHVEDEGDGLVFTIEDVSRAGTLAGLSLLFCGLLIYVGRKKGFNSLISIVITAILIFKFLSPMIIAGVNPILAVILICLISTAITMYLVGGLNRKSTAATVGCIFSLILAGLLSALTVKLAYLNGFSSEVSMFLYSAHPELNYVAIAISTIILAAMGAVMDVGMSISSTINEIYTVDNTKTFSELFKSGMNVGRDIIGTMANTLILVYLGASLPLIMIASNIDFNKFINLNQVVTEISSALIGSSAIVICVPITAIIAAYLIKKTPLDPSIINDYNKNVNEESL